MQSTTKFNGMKRNKLSSEIKKIADGIICEDESWAQQELLKIADSLKNDNLVNKKLRVSHYAQVPCKPFHVEVEDEYEAKRIQDILARQHLFLFENKIIPDYANIIVVTMWEEELEPDENGEKWTDYFNEKLCMEWKEFEEEYLKS